MEDFTATYGLRGTFKSSQHSFVGMTFNAAAVVGNTIALEMVAKSNCYDDVRKNAMVMTGRENRNGN